MHSRAVGDIERGAPMALSDHLGATGERHPAAVSRAYAWTVFALTFGLALSDYLSRQVISATFPFIKAEWSLSDAQLGGLASIVAVSVAVFAIPVSLLADRWGRVRSITLMAFAWCLATVACGFSANYPQMLGARGVVGISEAAYYSAGGALLASVFPPRRLATVFGIFQAGALFGSVIGVVLGGTLATHLGWRQAFIVVGAPGLVLAAVYPFVVRDYGTLSLEVHGGTRPTRQKLLEIVRGLVGTRAAVLVYMASGVQMFMPGVLVVWMPSYLHRYDGMAPDRAAAFAGLVVLVSGIGMSAGGALADRLGRRGGWTRARMAALYSVLGAAALAGGFSLDGDAALVLVFLGALLAAAHGGCSSAIVTEVTHPGVRATAMAMMILANNILGFAPGPLVVGRISDVVGLKAALLGGTATCVIAAVLFMLVDRECERTRPSRRVRGDREAAPVQSREASPH
jgi:MFS family permease